MKRLDSSVDSVARGIGDLQSSVTQLTLELGAVDSAVVGVSGALSTLEGPPGEDAR